MSKALGYHLTFQGDKCLSVSTGVQADGSYEFLVHTLAGSGVERHLHGYAYVGADGLIVCGGARIKNNVEQYLGPGLNLTQSTQEIARVTVRRSTGGVECQLHQLVGQEWLATQPTPGGGEVTRTEVPLPCGPDDTGGEYRIAMFDARSAVPSASSDLAVVRFSRSVPFGITLRRVG